MSKYLEFEEIPFKGKTKRFEILSKQSKYVLGRIYWYPQWRQYIFSSSYETIWNKDCLNDINIFLQKLMNDKKKILKDIHRISNWDE